MQKYKIIRSDTADSLLRNIILRIAENFGTETALEKLDMIENKINALEETPYIGVRPRDPGLRRRKYRVLILEKNMVFYKINEEEKTVMIYAITDQRQDYMNILRGL